MHAYRLHQFRLANACSSRRPRPLLPLYRQCCFVICHWLALYLGLLHTRTGDSQSKQNRRRLETRPRRLCAPKVSWGTLDNLLVHGNSQIILSTHWFLWLHLGSGNQFEICVDHERSADHCSVSSNTAPCRGLLISLLFLIAHFVHRWFPFCYNQKLHTVKPELCTAENLIWLNFLSSIELIAIYCWTLLLKVYIS